MIDLSKKGLPCAITVNGRLFTLNTGFRAWIKFSQGDYSEIFANEVPEQTEEAQAQILEFFVNANKCPRNEQSEDSTKTFDYLIDSDFIYAAFWQQYGIDLLNAELHWHKFLALFRGISDGTRLSDIMSIRNYRGNDKNMAKARRAWEIPDETDSLATEQQKYFDSLFETQEVV